MDEEIKKDFYNLNYSKNFELINNQEQDINVELDESNDTSSSITGQVVDNNGNPVDNATIIIFVVKENLIYTLSQTNKVDTLSLV